MHGNKNSKLHAWNSKISTSKQQGDRRVYLTILENIATTGDIFSPSPRNFFLPFLGLSGIALNALKTGKEKEHTINKWTDSHKTLKDCLEINIFICSNFTEIENQEFQFIN